jgi:hypothetical protein
VALALWALCESGPPQGLFRLMRGDDEGAVLQFPIADDEDFGLMHRICEEPEAEPKSQSPSQSPRQSPKNAG